MDIHVEIPLWAIAMFIAVNIFFLFALWSIFQKAGKAGWLSLVPLLNFYLLLKIVGKPGYWLFAMVIPLLNVIILIWTLNMLSKSFGHNEGFTFGLVFLGVFFLPILAFGSSKYQGPYGNKVLFDAYQGKNKFDFEQGN